MAKGTSVWAPTSRARRRHSSYSARAQSYRPRERATSPAALATWARVQRSPTRRAISCSSTRSASTDGRPPVRSMVMWARSMRVMPSSQSPPYRRQLSTVSASPSRTSRVSPVMNVVIGQSMPGKRAVSGPPSRKTCWRWSARAMFCGVRNSSGAWPSARRRTRSICVRMKLQYSGVPSGGSAAWDSRTRAAHSEPSVR